MGEDDKLKRMFSWSSNALRKSPSEQRERVTQPPIISETSQSESPHRWRGAGVVYRKTSMVSPATNLSRNRRVCSSGLFRAIECTSGEPPQCNHTIPSVRKMC
ncbi:ABC transporter G family member 23-like Protein [Tribolium castaneum]|uniref:ABC transporter G family member 23-like Protein n=1 Tax=Tribolium castaneum TaxID=7070 RepID=A0A139WBS3_TRICA|nr:ABC transporter G family member 23-like Protein [Tribolium castaneum]